MNKQLKEKQYQDRLDAAYKSAENRIKEGTLKPNEYTSYIRGYMREESKGYSK